MAVIAVFTLYAASRCRGDAAIYSFEPIPSTFAVSKTPCRFKLTQAACMVQVMSANAQAANSGRYDDVFKSGVGR
jgi:hypothetical protein